VDLAVRADSLGYERFWVAEHHNDMALASSSPAVMASHIAAKTDRIRVGSGGVLLPHHAPYAIAERFNLLRALAGDRIDLGVGRSGGSEGRAGQALHSRLGRDASFADVDELLAYLGPGSRKRPLEEVHASPRVEEAAPLWMLGSSPASAEAAGRRGLPYVFGAFLDPRHLLEALATYHRHFRPSAYLDAPYVMLAWVAFCGETEADASRMAACSELWFVETFLRGLRRPFPASDRAESAESQYSLQEQMFLQMKRGFASVGTPPQVVAELEARGREWAIDEWMIVTLCSEHEDRTRSYERLAEAAGLGGATSANV
jgi:luciferase family oxidoreductase group 1